MSCIKLLFLGILQGLTEFLPVSSSGHLVLLENFLKINPPGILTELSLHLGTLLAMVFLFRRELGKIVLSLVCLFKGGRHKRSQDPYLRLLFFMLLGTIPILIMGFCFREAVSRLFDTGSRFVSFMFVLTGIILWSTKRLESSRKEIGRLNGKDALAIGLAQAIALVPGVSRSGMTISCGLFRGLSKDAAYRFSFLLALPAIIGAIALEFKNLSNIPKEHIDPLLIGTVAAFLSGLVSLRILLSMVRKGKFYFFAYYLWFIGLMSLGASYLR
jgi:undecaprenyl-diphosphatase